MRDSWGGTGVLMAPWGSPGDAGQRGHQAGEVEGPGAAIAADELTTITAYRTLVLILLPQGSGQQVTTRQQAAVVLALMLARDPRACHPHHPFPLHHPPCTKCTNSSQGGNCLFLGSCSLVRAGS